MLLPCWCADCLTFRCSNGGESVSHAPIDYAHKASLWTMTRDNCLPKASPHNLRTLQLDERSWDKFENTNSILVRTVTSLSPCQLSANALQAYCWNCTWWPSVKVRKLFRSRGPGANKKLSTPVNSEVSRPATYYSLLIAADRISWLGSLNWWKTWRKEWGRRPLQTSQ